MFFNVHERISDVFNPPRIKEKLKNLDQYNDDYEEHYKKIKQPAFEVIDIFEKCATLQELNDLLADHPKIKKSVVIDMLKESHRHFGFDVMTQNNFDARKRDKWSKKREIFIYKCSKLVLVSVDFIVKHYGSNNLMHGEECYAKFLEDLK